MRFAAALLGVPAALGVASAAAAQACTPPAHPAFEFQVEQPAAYVGDSVLRPRPAAQRFARLRDNPQAFVVQFVVDTLGQPVVGSFKALHSPSAAASDSARTTMVRWRFTPAVKAGCKVPQLVQTALER
jgi:hypothetical protein